MKLVHIQVFWILCKHSVPRENVCFSYSFGFKYIKTVFARNYQQNVIGQANPFAQPVLNDRMTLISWSLHSTGNVTLKPTRARPRSRVESFVLEVYFLRPQCPSLNTHSRNPWLSLVNRNIPLPKDKGNERYKRKSRNFYEIFSKILPSFKKTFEKNC